MPREPEERDERDQTFTLPLLGALYGSVVIVAVVAVLDSRIGRGLEDEIDAPARTLVAAPLILAATVVFVSSMVALILPTYRRAALRVAEIAGWLIPAWLVMGACWGRSHSPSTTPTDLQSKASSDSRTEEGSATPSAAAPAPSVNALAAATTLAAAAGPIRPESTLSARYSSIFRARSASRF
jgi:hypothetical protein